MHHPLHGTRALASKSGAVEVSCNLLLQGETDMTTKGMGIALRAFKTRSHERDIPSPHKADQSKLNAEHLSTPQP